IHHGQGWFRTLVQKSEATREAIEKSAQQALLKVIEWFGPPDSKEDNELVAAEIKLDTNAAILGKLLNELGNLAENLKVDLALSKMDNNLWQYKTAPQWDGWNSQTRRIQKSGPDEQILYHLRGSKNKVFKLN
ncbi:MAG: hypothetical protein ACE5HX_19715, partial [bacterium]